MSATLLAAAFEQISSLERDFVVRFVKRLEDEAAAKPERITSTLARFRASYDPARFDDRTRAMLEKPMVGAAIAERVMTLSTTGDITPERIIKEHSQIAFGNMADFVETGEDGFPRLDLLRCGRDQWAIIKELKTEEEFGRFGGSKRTAVVKLYDKQLSLNMLAKWTGLDKPDNPEYVTYSQLPAKVADLPASATHADAGEMYARLIHDQ